MKITGICAALLFVLVDQVMYGVNGQFGGGFGGGSPHFGGDGRGPPPFGGNFSGPPPFGGNFSGLPRNFTGPPPFGGPGGPGGPPPMFPPGIDFVNNTCPVNTNVATPCLVGPPFNETSGAWVCRTLYNIVSGASDTFSACVDTNHFLKTDKCGCCGGVCPSTDPCKCACNMTMGHDHPYRRLRRGRGKGPPGNFTGFNGTAFFNTTGVLVEIIDDDSTPETMCVPANLSSKLIVGPGFFQRFECVTKCS